MKKIALTLIAVASLAATTAPAMAAPWQSINARQANLDYRIDQGVRNRSLTRAEATRLRVEYRSLKRLEARYRSTNGLQQWERVDLDRRFNALSARIRYERHDRQDRR